MGKKQQGVVEGYGSVSLQVNLQQQQVQGNLTTPSI